MSISAEGVGNFTRNAMFGQLVGGAVHDGRMLNWPDLDPARVERVLHMLVRDVYGAEAIDGAGGGDAQDLRWGSPKGIVASLASMDGAGE